MGATFQTDQRDVGGVVIAIAWIVAVLTLFYMLPWAVAATRGRSNQAAIALINLFVGWTVIGWIVAMVMACQAHQPVAATGHVTMVVAQNFDGSRVGPPAGWYPNPEAPGRRYWDGTSWTEHRAP
jgi:hypothetical protein